jgi:hypothetical protein
VSLVEEEVKGEESKTNYIQTLPKEIVMEIFKLLDVRTFLIACPRVNKEWHEIINSKKLSGKLFKSHCMGIWQDIGIYQAN